MQPTLIVGLGGTGLRVLQSLRALMKDAPAFQPCSFISLDLDRPIDEPTVPDIFVVSSVAGGTGADAFASLTHLVGPITRETVTDMFQHPDRLYRMAPHTFELFLGEVYRGLGYTVSHTKRSRDGGVDLFLTKDMNGMRHSYVVQCKHSRQHQRRIGVGYARDLLGVAIDRATTAAILITNVFFSADTLRFAGRHAARLFCVDRTGLLALMSRYLDATGSTT